VPRKHILQDALLLGPGSNGHEGESPGGQPSGLTMSLAEQSPRGEAPGLEKCGQAKAQKSQEGCCPPCPQEVARCGDS
jgi:hypothetical protein